MSDIARKAAEKCPVKTNADVDKCEAIIQAAIEEAIAQANESFKPFFEDVEYKSDKELEQIISQSDDTKRLELLLELAWGVIANAGGGDWDKESKDWQGAAEKWRDDYFAAMKEGK